MQLKEIEAYIRSRVGAVFSTEHADKIVSMISAHLAEPEPEPEPPQKQEPEQPVEPSD